MPHDNSAESDYGQDSFLDVVANVVGVLVILVMLVGIRASQSLTSTHTPTEVASLGEDAIEENTPLEIPPEETISAEQQEVEAAAYSQEELDSKLEQANRENHFQREGLKTSFAKLVSFSRQSKFQQQHRMELARLRAEMEQNIEERRNALSAESQAQYDVQNEIFQAKLELDQLSNEQFTLLSAPGTVEQIEIEPTPVAKRVEEDAIHLRLLSGSVCRVPFYELMEALEYEIDSIRRELGNNGQINRVVGPIDGFRMRMRTKKAPSNRAVTGPLVGHLAERDRLLQYYYFLPDSDELGQRLDQALLADSQLRQTLREARRQTSVVVLWVYEDSFDDYRVMRKLLKEYGFTIAVYNLPMGEPITASQNGREAWAQ